MIKLIRDRKTTAIPSSLCGTSRCKKEFRLLQSMRDEISKNRNNPNSNCKPKFSGQYWRDARKFLVAESGGAERETNGKCGYCESPPHPVTQGQVDHFRPKNIYWWLAYCYDNFVYSCPNCNQRKSNSFPIEGDRIPAPTVSQSMNDTELQELVGKLAPDPLDQCKTMNLEDFERSCQAEKPLLISPYSCDPELLLKWIPDEFLREVEVKVRDGANPREKRIFDTIEECYGLNRDGLKRWRWKRYKDLLERKEKIDSLDGIRGLISTNPEAARNQLIGKAPSEDLRESVRSLPLEEAFSMLQRYFCNRVEEMMEDRSPYAGMARYFVRVEWRLNLDY